MTGDISYDLVMEDDMGFIEGCYRVGSGNWQVLIINKKDIDSIVFVPSRWPNGILGLVIHVPAATVLNSSVAKQILSNRLGIHSWIESKGPDSIDIR